MKETPQTHGMKMSDERLRVHEYTREELREMREDGETYSDVLARVLPDEPQEDHVIRDEGEMVVIPVTQEVHQLATELAGDGVSVGRVIDFYLFKMKVEQTIPADELLEELYNRRG